MKKEEKKMSESLKNNTQLRSKEDLQNATEKIFNNVMNGEVSPKTGDVLNTCIKTVIKLNVDIPLKIENIFQKGKGRLYWMTESKMDKLIE